LNGVTVKGGTINTSFSNGISFEYNANNCSIDGVSVYNTNKIAGAGRSGSGSGVGILAAGENISITNNRVQVAGYNYRPALDGATALLSARAHPPALVILDLMLPDTDGFEVCRQLKGDATTASVPILMLTALDRAEQRPRAPALERVGSNTYTTTKLRGCNPCLGTTSDGVVVIDTPQLPTRAVAMRAEAEAHGPLRYLINTEHHVDHIFGNYWFKGVPVVNHQGLYDNFMDPTAELDPFAYALEAVPTDDPEAAPLIPDRDVYYQDPNNVGLVCTEDLVVMLDEMGIETGMDVDKILNAGRMAERIVGRRLRSETIKSGRIPKKATGF